MIVNKQIAKCTLLFCTLLIAASAFAQQPNSSPEAREVVWTWSKGCDGDHKLDVTVRIDRKVLYHGVLPICHGSRDAEDGRAEFHFPGGRTFQGKYRTRPTDSIEGDIWQAGGEQDGLILGISFDTGKQILLNTIHIANPRTRMSSEVDKGLFVTTYPVTVRYGRTDP
jgi:hypothetical protein